MFIGVAFAHPNTQSTWLIETIIHAAQRSSNKTHFNIMEKQPIGRAVHV